MVDTQWVSTDGQATGEPPEGRRDRPQLPAVLRLSAGDAQRVPSPGTQRALKAQTGRDYGQLCGPDADAADRFQTIIWATLRREHPGLLWEECADVEIMIDDAAGPALDPTGLGSSAAWPPSAASGG